MTPTDQWDKVTSPMLLGHELKPGSGARIERDVQSPLPSQSRASLLTLTTMALVIMWIPVYWFHRTPIT